MGGVSVPVVVGPTAVGKTAVAIALAAHLPVEVISADSRQIYRRLDIGTAKPTRRERARVPHHGIDVVEPGVRYSAGQFARDAARWVEEIRNRGRLPLVVGGTGLYIRALAEGLFHEPHLEAARRRALDAFTARLEPLELLRWAGRLDPGFTGGGRQRAARAIEIALLTGRPLSHWQAAARAGAAIDPWYVVLTVPRPVLQQRIARRAEEMVRRGLIEEVAAVLAEGHAAHAPGLDGIGIKEAVEYLRLEADNGVLLQPSAALDALPTEFQARAEQDALYAWQLPRGSQNPSLVVLAPDGSEVRLPIGPLPPA